jgi:hypothetical protein
VLQHNTKCNVSSRALQDGASRFDRAHDRRQDLVSFGKVEDQLREMKGLISLTKDQNRDHTLHCHSFNTIRNFNQKEDLNGHVFQTWTMWIT